MSCKIIRLQEVSLNSESPRRPKQQNDPLQRKTTLKWGTDGELSAVDMARILDKLAKSELTECDLACTIDDEAG